MLNKFKLLGLQFDYDLKCHVSAVSSNANSRIYFIRHFRRNGVGLDLLHVFEYTSIAWHHKKLPPFQKALQ